jgi:SAM-dependent methyltransferase
MLERATEPIRFFDDYPRFLETSKTGPSLDRLNARYTGLIHQNRHLLDGATVLDLASHDGRFSFAALQNGAERVVGIEVDSSLVTHAYENLATYGVSPDRYEFVQRDMFRHFDDLDQFDVVFCFGIFYHINDHMQLLTNIAGVEPRWLIVDTNISQLEGAVIELRSPVGASPPPPGSHLEGYPTRLALEVMLSSFGWESQYLDWARSGLLTSSSMNDYRDGMRISVVVRCTDPVAPDVRAYAVELVRAHQKERKTQWMTIRGVAERCDVNPYALRTWVLRAEGELPASTT